jgi:2-polyprenyl-3-methyl-5-hydroxy-6-metoxy-1,4-benzoquinol methylase
MSDDVFCPLCLNPRSELKKSLQVDCILRRWEQTYGIDVRDEFHGLASFELRRCNRCSLQFFCPDFLAGSPALYEKLEKFTWYYMPQKWEHDVALQDISGASNGIEIGCGFGDFVARVCREMHISFEGCEQNPSAVDIARRKRLSIHLDSIESLAKARPNGYDSVCSFQVLEHVSRPDTFLNAACTILRPDGKLILGLPNAASFLRHQFNLLDLPPHHMTRWAEDVLIHLQQFFPLELVRVAMEPLADYHVHDYVGAYSHALSKSWLHIPSIPAIQSRLARVIQLSGLRRFLKGQTIYACYKRI